MRIPKHMTTEIAPVPKAPIARHVRTLTLVHGEIVGEPGRRDPTWTLDERTLCIGRDPVGAGIALEDARASRRHAEVACATSREGHRIGDLASRNGTFVNGERVESRDLAHGDRIRIGDSLFVYGDTTLPAGLAVPRVAHDSSMLRALAEAVADLAAPTQLPISIVGPTGAGKELMAARIHRNSGRPGPLVAVNCATFGRDLIGSELFGHTAGAFSGAKTARNGLFVAADRGTLFLDEIAELPIEQQSALLRALQEGKVRPVGSDREVDVDVRVVTATHRDLRDLAERGQFREDLYARLAGFEIDLPGLRSRREEILPLFRMFFGGSAPGLSIDAAEVLLAYDWPQNVRELKHAAERARLFAEGVGRIEITALPSHIQRFAREGSLETAARVAGATATTDRGDDFELPSEDELRKLLREHDGNVASVARATGKHRQQVYRWIKRYGLEAGTFRSEPTDDVG